MLSTSDAVVSVAYGPTCYDTRAPFSPGTLWPEYRRVSATSSVHFNRVYHTVREALRLRGLDAERFGSPEWNPLGCWIQPGNTVVIKPNFVRDFRETSSDHADCITTHGSVIRAVLDYAYIALHGRGRLIIADAPQNDADFDAIRRIAHLDEIVQFYRSEVGFEVEVSDLRPQAAVKIDGVIVGHRNLCGDPAGYVRLDLGGRSAFAEIADLCSKLYGAEYARDEVVRHHTAGTHEYLISRTVLEADCVISVPKLKTHKKVGLTANMKNLVGINGNKNWLPHHREGSPAQGGDQFSQDGLLRRAERVSTALFKRWFPQLGSLRPLVAGPAKALGRQIFGDTNVDTVRSGNWHGNDTTWRMVLDLNRILFYGDAAGGWHEQPVRRFFSVVDGIVAGEGNGPLDPRPRPAGVIIAGSNPVAVDLTCARLMGFDYTKIPMLRHALIQGDLPLVSFSYADILSRSNEAALDRPLADLFGPLLGFVPHFGWKGHVEIAGDPHEARTLA
jgi:uncharacterized protein (DUF362 family)